jgi:hypothetical protein
MLKVMCDVVRVRAHHLVAIGDKLSEIENSKISQEPGDAERKPFGESTF